MIVENPMDMAYGYLDNEVLWLGSVGKTFYLLVL